MTSTSLKRDTRVSPILTRLNFSEDIGVSVVEKKEVSYVSLPSFVLERVSTTYQKEVKS